jgi:hypothetical protein
MMNGSGLAGQATVGETTTLSSPQIHPTATTVTVEPILAAPPSATLLPSSHTTTVLDGPDKIPTTAAPRILSTDTPIALCHVLWFRQNHLLIQR